MNWNRRVGSKSRAIKFNPIIGAIGVICLSILALLRAHAFANNTTARSTIVNLVFYTSYDTGDV